ncbi:MBL fold metallo-hydrolase [Roseibium sediminicola]|uniref:MBL fold metallo-hydrolase n=1 Tax=Roseibium sediminicola TaxID=2933272 RepID=A0ABT0GST3_9HYPH|nr:MBL fold metallo-hydrolase [Roseibium sp. CAU 1639]MCK7612496.1 MBL fold metallo-hydrolase [Roseibium sp. CAU 1639]
MLDTDIAPCPTAATTVGDLTVTALPDGYLDIPAAYFSNLTPEEAERVTPAARFGANTWLIEAGDRRILVDAGSGHWLKERFPASGALDWAGDDRARDRADITDIIVTHMHADHIGGLVAGAASLFPQAEIHVQAVEWDFWTDEALPTSAPEDRRPLIALIQSLAAPLKNQIRLHSGETDLGHGIRLAPAPGHTPGHQIVHLSSGPDQLLLLADTVVSDALQFANPEVRYALDSDPDQAAVTRKKLFERLTADGIPFAATHLATENFGVLKRLGEGFCFQPL